MRIINQNQHTVLSTKAEIADTFFSRMKGLLGRRSLAENGALVITRCQSIHMFFMLFAIDVIFLDNTNRVVGLVKNIKPFFLSPIFFKASYAIELPVGCIEKTKTEVGDYIKLEE